MKLLPVERACQLTQSGPQTRWLIDELWTEQAVGILGGEPKCCKTFLALDMAVSVASGTPCLRRFPVRRAGKVLLFPAEDSLAVVRQRLEGISAAAGLCLNDLPVDVITAPVLRLDRESDTILLANTVQSIKPDLLILDPLIRLHRADENDASQMAALLSFLRHLQRTFQLAVVVVHHARKGSSGGRPGQALRGSSELHGWGDSNLYLRRYKEKLTLTTEHRAAASRDDLHLQLTEGAGEALSLSLDIENAGGPGEPGQEANSPVQRVYAALQQFDAPVSLQQVRKSCAMRTASVCAALAELTGQGVVIKQPGGYQLQQPDDREQPAIETSSGPAGPAAETVSGFRPVQSGGNGNGKPPPVQSLQQRLPGF